MTHYSQDGAAHRMSTGPPGRWTDPAEWRAFAEDRARAGRIRARHAANAAVGFWSAWRQADSAANRHLGHADALDRIAAFTDEMTELLAVNHSSPNSLPEPDNASSDPAHSRNADSCALFAECEKALRAAAGLPA